MFRLNLNDCLPLLGVLLACSQVLGQSFESIKVTADVSCAFTVPVDLNENLDEAKTMVSRRVAWNRFTASTVFAPVWIAVDPILDQEMKRVAHRIHFWFSVHQPIARLRDRDWMESLFAAGDSGEDTTDSFRSVNRDELEERQVWLGPSARAARVTADLMNRVRLKGLIVANQIDETDEVQLYWRVQDNLPLSSEYAATWSPIKKNNLGETVIGDARPYRGAGGIVNLQPLPGDEDEAKVTLIQCQIILAEPDDWFAGRNFLRSKFSVLIQEAVRNFRRRLSSSPP